MIVIVQFGFCYAGKRPYKMFSDMARQLNLD
uniref:Uncharacterized protein n=1 Tax=Anguilla anguilla TaxID=7936 RepID=A0A0E9U5M2_ANGAN